MAFRTFQFCIVFTIGFYTGPAQANVVANAPAGTSPTNLSLTFTDPQDVIVTRGQSAVLHCPVDNTKPGGYTVQWLYTPFTSINYTPIVDDAWRTSLPNGTLYMKKVPGKKVKEGIEGEYRCIVNNTAGKLLSSPAKLKIAAIAKTFSEQPQNVEVEEGQPVYLPCVIQSTPTAVIRWNRDGNQLPQNTKYVPLPSGGLLITTVQQTDAGSYRCTAVNEMIKSKNIRISNDAVITVVPTGKINKLPSFLPVYDSYNFTAEVGDELRLFCSANGRPKPTIKWTFNSRIISDSTILLLRNLTINHNGTYICSARNSVGQTTKEYNVEIVERPHFTKTPSSQLFPSAHTVRLECKAEGHPTPQIQWFKDGQRIHFTGRFRLKTDENSEIQGLVLLHTFSTDSGLYQCVATNKVGSIWTAAQLIAVSENRPTPPRNIRCRPIDNTKICLQWDPLVNVNVSAYSIHSFYTDTGLGLEYLSDISHYLIDGLRADTNYSFYIRVYTKKSASDHSKNITCQTKLPGERNMYFKAKSSTILEIEWDMLSSDVPCGSAFPQYKLQWRRFGLLSNNVVSVNTNYSIIRGLIPLETYEMRVQTTMIEDEQLQWFNFTMPYNILNDSSQSTKLNRTDFPVSYSNVTVLAPIGLEAFPTSSKSINLTWIDPRLPENKLAGYYMICYAEVKAQQNCEKGTNFIKSNQETIEIKGLKPYTSYEFRVRIHNLDGNYGSFSNPVECRTNEDVPSAVVDLKWKLINSSAVCLKWHIPVHHNGILKNYVISYTSDPNVVFENWPYVVFPITKNNTQGCWIPSIDTVSSHLTSLDEGKKYLVIVRAATSAGIGKPTEPIKILISHVNKDVFHDIPQPDNSNGLPHDQTLGIIIGTIISGFCIIFCTLYIVCRRRCVKTRGLDRTRAANLQTTNGRNSHQPQSIATVPNLTCQPVTMDRHCPEAEIHELQCLVGTDGSATHIPPVVHSHIDTKGGPRYPNGQVNGLKYYPLSNGHVPNGNVHITENPQYEHSYECNGHFNSTSESRQLLTADAERSGNSDDTLNSTQLTSLEDTLPLSTTRTISPVLGPNG